MWRMQIETELSLDALRRLLAHVETLAPRDRRALLGRLAGFGTSEEMQVLAAHSDVVARFEPTAHALFGAAMINGMMRESVRRTKPARMFRLTKPPDISDFEPVLLGMIQSDLTLVHERARNAASSRRAISPAGGVIADAAEDCALGLQAGARRRRILRVDPVARAHRAWLVGAA